MVIEFGRSAYGEPVISADERYERAEDAGALVHFLGRAARGEIGGGLITGPRGSGKTELLHRAVSAPPPQDPSAVLIYYPVQPYRLELFDLARSYFNTLIRQYRHACGGEKADLQQCVDAWHSGAPQCRGCREACLRELCEAMGRAYAQRDETEMLLLVANVAHYLAQLQNRRCLVILDNARYLRQVHHRARAVPLLRHLSANLESPLAPVFLVDSPGALRALLGEQASNSRHSLFEVAPLRPHQSVAMFQTLGEQLGVPMSLRLIERFLPQLGGLPLYIHALARRAHLAGVALTTAESFGQVYAQEIRDGGIHWYWRAQFSMQFPQAADRQRAVEVCAQLAGCYPHRAAVAALGTQLLIDPARLNDLAAHLQFLGVSERSFSALNLVNDPVLRDVATVLAWGESASITDAELLRRLAARRVRMASTPPLEETIAEFLGRVERLLEAFRGQYLPSEWFRYHDDYAAEWAKAHPLRNGTSATLVRLPYLTAVARVDVATGIHTTERPIVVCGRGYRDRQLTPGNETQWLTVIWPNPELLTVHEVQETLWVRSAVERRTGRDVRHTWLISRNGFTREARRLAAELRILSGSRDMVDWVHDQVFAPDSPWREPAETSPSGPEMIVPPERPPMVRREMGMFLTAESAPRQAAMEGFEDLARESGFPPERIVQMRLALFEAMIHCAETASDPSDTIHIHCVALPNRIEVSVRSGGFGTEPGHGANGRSGGPDKAPAPQGRNLTLIGRFADEVALQSLEPGIEIQLTFRHEAEAAEGGEAVGNPA